MYLESIEKAYNNIKDVINFTPLLYSPTFSKDFGNKVYIKCENLQLTGAYKIRGALNKIRGLNKDELSKGVICSSVGNHAQGVAYASNILGIKSTIVMPKTTPYLKVQSTIDYGGEVILYGDCYDDCYTKAIEISETYNKTFIHPFDDLDIIYGQGTIALEIFEQLKDIDVIVCPIGGGGLISGISLAAKEINPNIKIIGVQGEEANAMEISFKRGEKVSLDKVNTIADGISVKCPGNITYNIINKYVDDIVTVSDNEISEAFIILCEKHKLLAETSGAVSLAALKKLNFKDKNIVSIISGGNIDMLTISSLIKYGLVERGRLFCFTIDLPDKTWQIFNVSRLLSQLNANIVNLEHNQFKANNKLKNVQVEITVETNGKSHIDLIKQKFNEEGYELKEIY